MIQRSLILLLLFFLSSSSFAQGPTMYPVAPGWANNSINVVVFRKNSLVTFRDTQFISFYDENRFVVLGKRKIGSANWEIKHTSLQANTNDAHNTIAIIVDGEGYLHIAWNHHNNSLHYCRSVNPGSLELTSEMQMTGKFENKVTYPEFYRMPNGNLLFFYRDGASGEGNLIINRFDVHLKKWEQIQSNLVDGEGKRNAYWQACVDSKGTIHLSWVWRETPDVASNHDMCYARSKDGGITWEKSTGKKYSLPINEKSAEYIVRIPQGSELINQTSMCVNDDQQPYIATYYREKGSSGPQYHLLYNNGKEWKIQNCGFRISDFSLSGAGTKRIPISRPQVVAWRSNKKNVVAIIYRDAERDDKITIAISDSDNFQKWKLKDLTDFSVGSWEPTYDTELWKQKKILDIFVERVEQLDAEGKANMQPQLVQVLEYKPKS